MLFFHNRNYFQNQIKQFLLLAQPCVCLGCVTLHTPSLACSASPSRNGMAKELKSCREQTNTMIELIKNHFHDCGTSHLLHKNTIMNNSQIYCGFLLNGSKVKLYTKITRNYTNNRHRGKSINSLDSKTEAHHIRQMDTRWVIRLTCTAQPVIQEQFGRTHSRSKTSPLSSFSKSH